MIMLEIKQYRVNKSTNKFKLNRKINTFNKLSEKMGKDVEAILNNFSGVHFTVDVNDKNLNKVLRKCKNEVNKHYMFFINRYTFMYQTYKLKEIFSIFTELIELNSYRFLDLSGLSVESQNLLDKYNDLPLFSKTLFLYMVDVARIEEVNEVNMDKRYQITLYSDKTILPLIDTLFLERAELLKPFSYHSILRTQDKELAWFTAYYLTCERDRDDSIFWQLFVISLSDKKEVDKDYFNLFRAFLFVDYNWGYLEDIFEYTNINNEIYNSEVIKRKQMECSSALLEKLK